MRTLMMLEGWGVVSKIFQCRIWQRKVEVWSLEVVRRREQYVRDERDTTNNPQILPLLRFRPIYWTFGISFCPIDYEFRIWIDFLCCCPGFRFFCAFSFSIVLFADYSFAERRLQACFEIWLRFLHPEWQEEDCCCVFTDLFCFD